MTDKLISFNENRPSTGLPEAVETRFNAEYGGSVKRINRESPDPDGNITISMGAVGQWRTANATPFLAIPTPDDLPSVGHPDVIVIEGGWNGFAYWMGFTPYPDEPRENPNIAASHDGVNWVIPDGLTNPIASFSEAGALGYSYWSDTDLVHLPDGRLACYFRGTVHDVSDTIVRKVSSDGVTWGPVETVLPAGFTEVLSPAIVVEDDSTFSMWSINGSLPVDSPARLERRTSLDGATWSVPTTCTLPAIFSGQGYAWHVDMIRVGEMYHALIATRDPYRLFYRWSKDGINWEGSATHIPLTGYDFDQSGHYRSTLVALPGGKFDIWINGINSPDGEWEGPIFTTAQWRIGLLRDVNLRYLTPGGNQGTSTDSLWVWASQFVTTYGAPTQEFVEDVTPMVGFAENETTSVSCLFPPAPADWGACALDVLYSVPTGGADVRISTRMQRFGDGTLLALGVEEMRTMAVPAAPNTAQFAEVRAFAIEWPHDQMVRVTVARVGTAAEDTLGEKFRIIGFRLRRVS